MFVSSILGINAMTEEVDVIANNSPHYRDALRKPGRAGLACYTFRDR